MSHREIALSHLNEFRRAQGWLPPETICCVCGKPGELSESEGTVGVCEACESSSVSLLGDSPNGSLPRRDNEGQT